MLPYVVFDRMLLNLYGQIVVGAQIFASSGG